MAVAAPRPPISVADDEAVSDMDDDDGSPAIRAAARRLLKLLLWSSSLAHKPRLSPDPHNYEAERKRDLVR